MELRIVDPLLGALGGLFLGVELAMFGETIGRGDWLWTPIVSALHLDTLFATSPVVGFAAVLIGGSALGTAIIPPARAIRPGP